MYHIIVFQKTNEVEVAAVKWVEERSMWPSAAAGCVTTTFTSNDYHETRWKRPAAVRNSDAGTDDDSPIKHKRRKSSAPSPSSYHSSAPSPSSYRPSSHHSSAPSPSSHHSSAPSPSSYRPSSHHSSAPSPSSYHSSAPSPSSYHSSAPSPSSYHSSAPSPSSHRSSAPSPSSYRPSSHHSSAPSPSSLHPSTPSPVTQHNSPPSPGILRCSSRLHLSLLKNILINQEVMMDQIKIIYKTIQGLETPSEDEFLLSSFPLNDQQSVEQMEAELHDNPELHKHLITALALKGGGSLTECVGRIMAALFTHSLSKQINWRGVNGKIGFQHLQIKKLVTVAVRRNRLTSAATDKEIDVRITKWLQNAADRNGGRNERRKRRKV